MSLPLEGIKVLDLSRYLPGPFCTQLLADFGAEVIKVEDPRGGDLGRHLAPLIEGQSARFYTVNRNKKSVTINFKNEQGKEIFKQLVKSCDIVIDQFRPGVMDKMGLGYADLKKINDQLIYCCITGYGLTGPLRDAAGHDQNYLSLAGVTGLTGTYKGKPAISGVQIADIAGGTLYAVIAILLALEYRNKTGKGQLCDVAMMDGAISLLAYTLGEWSGWGELPEMGNDVLTGGYACYNIYETKDHQFMTLGIVEEKFWAKFCKKVGRDSYIDIQWEIDRQEELQDDIAGLFRQKTRAEWTEFFAQDDICLTPVLNLDEMCRHPQTMARNMIMKLADVRGSGKDIVLTGVPIKLSESPGEPKLSFADLGEHNYAVLKSAGYSDNEIEEFKKNNAI